MNKKIHMFIVTFFIVTHCLGVQRQLTLTVFVHGSVFPALACLNPWATWWDTLHEQSAYVRAIQKVRAHPQLQEEQIMLQQGLHMVPNAVIQRFHAGTATREECGHAAFFVISLYDQLSHVVDHDTGDCVYYTFGHEGLLSESYRKHVGHALYHALIDEISRYKKDYEQINVVIVGHSHGGNCALYVADAEKKYEQGLQVNDLILLGTPICQETMVYAYQPVFERVINIYSRGDFLQCVDTISVASGKTFSHFSHKHFNDLRAAQNEPNKVYDISLSINGDAEKVSHKNFWFLGRSHSISDLLGPLPCVVLVPLIVSQLNNVQARRFDLTINDTEKTLRLQLVRMSDKTCIRDAVFDSAYRAIADMRNMVVQSWCPVNKSREITFRYNNGEFVKKQLGYWTWWWSTTCFDLFKWIRKVLW